MGIRLPIDCVLAVTYQCNSRCVMCDIWKIKDKPALKLKDYAKLPSSLRYINLSGGEPFLNSDLPKIVDILRKVCPKAQIVISSNGLATDLIVKQVKEIIKINPKIGFAFSVDGIGKTHDEIRGVSGAYEKVLKTISELQKLGINNIRIAFTLSVKNFRCLKDVYDLSQKLGVEFTHSYAQSSDFYFGGKQIDNFGLSVNKKIRAEITAGYDYIIKQELKYWNIKRWGRAFYAEGMKNFVLKKKQILSSSSGRDFFFLDPNGFIYPSVIQNIVMGDLREIKDFKAFWRSAKTGKIRKKIDKAEIPVWMMCTARAAMRRSPFKVLFWVLKNKFFRR